MTGYQEILTDPSYKGQIVTMTYPLIGNYGVNRQDVESWCPHVAGFVIRELSPVVSNWRAESSLAEYLAQYGIPGIQGIDTRALTRKLRVRGALNGFISTEGTTDAEAVRRIVADAAIAKAACTGVVDPIVAVVAASEDPFVLAVGHTAIADSERRRGTVKKDRGALEDAEG
jgi:carbamoyl-phosphate synthase small subunit